MTALGGYYGCRAAVIATGTTLGAVSYTHLDVYKRQYLYGARDLWQNGEVSEEQVQSQLILYCGCLLYTSC